MKVPEGLRRFGATIRTSVLVGTAVGAGQGLARDAWAMYQRARAPEVPAMVASPLRNSAAARESDSSTLGKATAGDEIDAVTDATTDSIGSEPEQQAEMPLPGGAKFEPRFEQPSSPVLAEVAQRLANSAVVDGETEMLNYKFPPPVPVVVAAAECGVVNAFYDPSSKTVKLCYELVQAAEAFGAQYGTTSLSEQAPAGGALRFILMHEVGHALVDVLDLPVMGREEDVVDQIATLFLIGDHAAGTAAALAGARFLAFLNAGQALGADAFAGEHGLGPQRFYNIVCWIYGSDPARYASVVARGTLPADRAARCPAEYAKIVRSWQRLIIARVSATDR